MSTPFILQLSEPLQKLAALQLVTLHATVEFRLRLTASETRLGECEARLREWTLHKARVDKRRGNAQQVTEFVEARCAMLRLKEREERTRKEALGRRLQELVEDLVVWSTWAAE